MKLFLNLFGIDKDGNNIPDVVVGEGRLETSSETWGFVSQWAEKEIARLRESNDSIMVDELKTAAIRGRIKALKDLLDLPKPKKVREKKFVQEDY